jgi:hypothetical protein
MVGYVAEGHGSRKQDVGIVRGLRGREEGRRRLGKVTQSTYSTRRSSMSRAPIGTGGKDEQPW